ncbi:MAG: hypothetical protein VW576_06245, partial [Opitutae bacterium]
QREIVSMYPISHFLLGLALLLPLSLLPAKTYIWTDTNGQQIEAEFVRCSADTLTISMQGQELDLPINSLSAFSKALAIKLRSESAPAKPANLHAWKDLQGRVIQAQFLGATDSTVRLLWNGQPFELSLGNLSQESKNLARRLLDEKNGVTPTPAPYPQQPVVNQEKEESIEGTDPDGPLDLDAMQVWVSADDRALRAKFIEFEGGELSVLTSSDQEVQIDQENLSPQAIALAKKLKTLNDERKKAIKAFADLRKTMKVPSVSDQDLDKVHQFKNTEGVTISANFIDADDSGVTITLAGKSQPLELTWDRFSKESQALLEALRRKSLTANRAPTTIPAKGGKIGYFANGTFKGYNSVIQTERFDVALSSSGTSLKIWLKSDNPKVSSKTFGVGLRAEYTDKTNPKKWRKKGRPIISFNSPPEPSMNREKTTLTGSFSNGGTFQYDIELNSKGLLFWGKVRDPGGEEWPTRFSIVVSVPGFVPDSKNKQMDEIMPYIGDGTLIMQPESGKSRAYPYKEKWATISNKFKGQKFGSLKSATVMGFPYGNNKMMITPTNTSGMSFNRYVSYGRIFPFQGFSFEYEGRENKKEIPKNKALKILLTGV